MRLQNDQAREQMQQITDQRMLLMTLPHVTLVKRAAQLDNTFWEDVVASAVEVLRTRGEFPSETPSTPPTGTT